LAKIFKNFRQQHADCGQTVTDNYFSGGLWTGRFRALSETVNPDSKYSTSKNLNP